ncbi:hypothetical protein PLETTINGATMO_17840 [Pseudothermotoga lettingae TMO]|nr:polysaccharide deacetylase family protein [Pseudothermotoga sp.]GLI49615.1 hypothetical protein PLETTINGATMO_17840 [Pseudothermotoga lettingae TMO]
MKQKKIAMFVIAALTVLATCAYSKVVVFLYHRFDDTRYPSTNTWTYELENHIKIIKDMGLEIWNMKDLEEYVYGEKHPKSDAVVFTVDDGYRSVYDYAYKIFKKHEVPFTVFIQVGAIGYPDYLTWEMIKEMLKDGVEFANHSYTHTDFPALLTKMTLKEMLDYFKQDFEKAQQVFLNNTGKEMRYYAYPYGYYIPEMIDVLRNEGVKLAFSQNPGPYISSYGAFEIPREPLLEDWASESHLRYILNREALLTEEIPFKIENNTLTVKGTIIIPKQIRDISVYVSEKGIVDSLIIQNIVTTDPVELRKRYNRLMISARDGKKEYVKYWLLFNVKGD